MRFARRTEFEEETSDYSGALRHAKLREGFLDLTTSNPTRCGFDYSGIDLNELSADKSLHYNADSFGMPSAREAVVAMYPGIDPAQILLTASTSEAYSYLLRLFCEPGDAILVPSPSYPLFDLLARLHDVELRKYPLVYHDGWQIDPASLEAAVTAQTKAIVAIHPNNPTGHYCSAADRAALHAVAARHGLPLIVDEVFLDYAIEGGSNSFATVDAPVLTFVMGGLSKLLALPQMKLAWSIACGPQHEVAQAMERLEVVADTFLSVATPVQVALPLWLKQWHALQLQLLHRVKANLATLDASIRHTRSGRLRVEGGWCAVLRVPAVMEDGAFAVRLLHEESLAVHPGSFYDFPDRGWLVVSLIVPEDAFREGVERLVRFVESL